MNSDYIPVILVISGLLLIVVGIFNDASVTKETAETYKAECIKAEGKPVYNGRNWECLK